MLNSNASKIHTSKSNPNLVTNEVNGSSTSVIAGLVQAATGNTMHLTTPQFNEPQYNKQQMISTSLGSNSAALINHNNFSLANNLNAIKNNPNNSSNASLANFGTNDENVFKVNFYQGAKASEFFNFKNLFFLFYKCLVIDLN